MPDGKKWRLQTLRFDRVYDREQAQLWNIGARREKECFGAMVLAKAWLYKGIIQPHFVYSSKQAPKYLALN